MEKNLTSGGITAALLKFAAPMIAGNLLQQVYNLADTFVVGRYLGEDALAAVGSTYTLTTFIYSIIIGLCMGSGSLVSYYYGSNNSEKQRKTAALSFAFILIVAVISETLTLCFTGNILSILRTPSDIMSLTADYVQIILAGIIFIFLYNFYAYMLRASGDSFTPLVFLGTASVLNVILDVIFVVFCGFGVKGAAFATLLAQAVSGTGLAVYSVLKERNLRFGISDMKADKKEIAEVLRMSSAASVQQSVMNFGILMIQGLVNSFGTVVMAAFTVAVKIDTLAYMPAQEFGNAFSIFISQNYGAGKYERIQKCVKRAFMVSGIFCLVISAFVGFFSEELMCIFVDSSNTDIIKTGSQYLMTEGTFYIGIGVLFLLYGYYRGINKPEMSLILTVISLGLRVLLAYILSGFEQIGVFGIWISIPTGWIIADITGCIYMKKCIKIAE